MVSSIEEMMSSFTDQTVYSHAMFVMQLTPHWGVTRQHMLVTLP